MQFLYPNFLWALLALAIPIIIHLFYFRRFKKIKFSNVKFLKEIKEETASRNKLKNLLILAMRCLALAALVFAFAQPYLSKDQDIKQGSKAISIFLDNSESMRSEKESIPLFELAKDRARKIINAYDLDDQFQVLSNDFEAKHQRLVSKEDALSLIDDISITPDVKSLDRVLKRQKQVLNEDENIIYILSDFQESITNIPNEIDSLYEVNLLPIQSIIEKNVSIDSIYFDSPVPILNQTNKLIVRVTNRSEDPADRVKLSLQKDGQVKPVGVLNIPANTTVIDTIPLSILRSGFHEGIIKIIDFPIQFDDELYFSFNVENEIKALALNDGNSNKYLKALFNGINYFKLDNQDLSQIQFQKFSEYNLILLNDIRNLTSGLANELQQYLENGGKIIVFPSLSADINSYNTFLSNAGANKLNEIVSKEKVVSKINTDEFIFADVFESIRNNIKLPSTQQNFNLSQFQKSSGETILTYRDNTSFITKTSVGKGFLYQCAAPLNNDYNNLVLNAEIFVPMLYKMALATGIPEKLTYWIGKENIISIPNEGSAGELIYTITGASEFIPGVTNYGKSILLDINNQVKKAGFYKLKLAQKELKSLAFNYDRRESNLNVFSPTELEDNLRNSNINIINANDQNQLAAIVTQKDKGVVLWKWFIFACLIFLLLESIIIRFVKS
jgi:hypothetical protein